MPSEYFDYVCLGGGVAAGYWAEELVELRLESGSRSRKKICIISAYPEGLAPYERPAVSKGCLKAENTHLRDWQQWGKTAFPFTSLGSGGEARAQKWYRDNNITVLWGCECVEADVSGACLRLVQHERTGTTRTREVTYGSLLIATGASPRKLGGEQETALFCKMHSDVRGLRLLRPEMYGLGSVHYLRDMGDCVKLAKALGTKATTLASRAAPSNGGNVAEDAVAVVGGGFIAMEVAAAILSYYPGVTPVILMDGPHLMHGFFSADLASFYEKRLEAKGARLVRNVWTERLWGLKESGQLNTLEGVVRKFPPAPLTYSSCRGVVVCPSGGGDDMYVPARMVVVGVGGVPNSGLFTGSLLMAKDGGILVDSGCRVRPAMGTGGASAPELIRPVFAAGDVASFPLPLEGNKIVRHEHVQNARDMAVVAARNMFGDGAPEDDVMYDVVPSFYSRLLDLSWKFFGVAEGSVVVMGLEDFETTRTMGAFWVRDERVVGALLEGGTQEQQAALEEVARLRPKVFSARVLKGVPLGDFLEDPGSIEADDNADLSQLLMCCRCV